MNKAESEFTYNILVPDLFIFTVSAATRFATLLTVFS